MSWGVKAIGKVPLALTLAIGGDSVNLDFSQVSGSFSGTFLWAGLLPLYTCIYALTFFDLLTIFRNLSCVYARSLNSVACDVLVFNVISFLH